MLDVPSTISTISEKIYTLSIISTGRCNTACTYCHYYATRSRKEVKYDISDELFDVYLEFINQWCEIVPGNTSYRFSGGDPMVLGDRLFRLADRGLRRTGRRPFMLTAGKALSEQWVAGARNSALSHVFVSVENPIEPDRKAPNPFKVIESIKRWDSPGLPIKPGVCVVPNHLFKDLYKICEWFMNEIGTVPLICEVNYLPYVTPTEEEWRALEDVLPSIIRDFGDRTHLNLFSSVIPEYAYGGNDPYIMDLTLDNSYQINSGNIRQKVEEIRKYIEARGYPELSCLRSECPWHDFCGNTKWYWRDDGKTETNKKLADYCRFKRIMSDSYYQVLIDPNHEKTTCEIRL